MNSVASKEEKVKLPGQEFGENDLLALRAKGENLAIKGPSKSSGSRGTARGI